MRIKAVLFDMDGVLIEAKKWHYDALNQALSLVDMSISLTDHLSRFDGLPTKKKLEILSIEKNLPRELHGFINEMKQHYTMEIISERCKPNSIHEYAMSQLKERGYKIAVCSNSVRNSVSIMMDKSGLNRYLDLKLSNEDVTRGKPDPEIYIKAISYFKLQPEECLIIEDNEHGIKAARASGAHLLVVKEITETNFNNIMTRIKEIEEKVLIDVIG